MSPSHFFDTAFGGSAHGVARYGLTAKGREMVSRMEARGVLLDVAHASARTIDDALSVSRRPVIASHTGVRGIADNARNLSDEHLAGIAASGGVVGIGFWETACGGPTRRRSHGRSPTRSSGSDPRTSPGLRLGRRGGRAVRRRRDGAARRRAARRRARRGVDPGGDGGERAAAARGDACRGCEQPGRRRLVRATRGGCPAASTAPTVDLVALAEDDRSGGVGTSSAGTKRAVKPFGKSAGCSPAPFTRSRRRAGHGAPVKRRILEPHAGALGTFDVDRVEGRAARRGAAQPATSTAISAARPAATSQRPSSGTLPFVPPPERCLSSLGPCPLSDHRQ